MSDSDTADAGGDVQPSGWPYDSAARFVEAYPASAWLVTDLDPVNPLDTVIARLVGSNFFWTGQRVNGETYLSNGAGGEGDCGTLAETLKVVATFFGYDASTNSYDGPLFVENGGAISGASGLAGNIDGGPDWMFEGHITAVVDGQEIDMLFQAVPADPGRWVKATGTGFEDVDGQRCEYWDFNNVRVWQGPALSGIDTRYTRFADVSRDAMADFAAQLATPSSQGSGNEAEDDEEDMWDLMRSGDATKRRSGVVLYLQELQTNTGADVMTGEIVDYLAGKIMEYYPGADDDFDPLILAITSGPRIDPKFDATKYTAWTSGGSAKP